MGSAGKKAAKDSNARRCFFFWSEASSPLTSALLTMTAPSRSMVSDFSLEGAKTIVANDQKTSNTTSKIRQHLIGVAWIRLMDIKFDPEVRTSLDPRRIHQVKRSIRERGLCDRDPPISVMSTDLEQTRALRGKISRCEAEGQTTWELDREQVRVTFVAQRVDPLDTERSWSRPLC